MDREIAKLFRTALGSVNEYVSYDKGKELPTISEGLDRWAQ